MIGRVVAMFLGGLGAVGASQAPEFAQQYAQRLGGAVDELRAIVQNFDQDAAREGLTREAGLQRLEGSTDGFVMRRGRSLRGTVERYERLQAQQAAMTTPDAVSRVVALAKGYDAGIARRAMDDFRPAVPVTLEGLFFGLAGFLGGALAGAGLAAPFARAKGVKAYPARR